MRISRASSRTLTLAQSICPAELRSAWSSVNRRASSALSRGGSAAAQAPATASATLNRIDFISSLSRGRRALLHEELPHLHGVLQAPLAHIGLVEEILHDLEQHCRLVRVDERQVDDRVRAARED